MSYDSNPDVSSLGKPGATAVNPNLKKVKIPAEGLLRDILQRLRLEFDDYKNQVGKSMGGLADGIQSIANRATATGEQVMRVFTILGDVETRLETIKTVLIRADVVTEDGYEATWDVIKGLRVKRAGELVTEGDFVRVSFKAVEGETVVGDETDFPVRVGGGHLVIENDLIGRVVGCDPFEVVQTYPKDFPFNPNLSGKTVTFSVTLGRVKTAITASESAKA